MRKSYRYINDFLFFVIKYDGTKGKGVLVYCSGVNLRRFLPITGGRHGLASNPALRGLQIVNRGIRALALSAGATPRTSWGDDCGGIAPTEDPWYSELLLIENAPETFPDEMINYCVHNILRTINTACRLEEKLPDRLLNPDELEALFLDWCKKYDGPMRRPRIS